MPDFVHAEEELDLAGAVLDMGKRDLAHRPGGTNASRQGDLDFPAILFRGFEFGDGLGAGMGPLGAGGIRLDALGAQFFEFLQTDFFE